MKEVMFGTPAEAMAYAKGCHDAMKSLTPTARDLAAAAALTGLLASRYRTSDWDDDPRATIAGVAGKYADAMLKERESHAE